MQIVFLSFHILRCFLPSFRVLIPAVTPISISTVILIFHILEAHLLWEQGLACLYIHFHSNRHILYRLCLHILRGFPQLFHRPPEGRLQRIVVDAAHFRDLVEADVVGIIQQYEPLLILAEPAKQL